MGCGASLAQQGGDGGFGLASLLKDAHLHPRETRILQIEEVDSFEDCEDGSQLENDEEYAIREASLASCTHMAEITGAWVWGISAGGSRNNVEMFAVNPQYLLQIGHEDLVLRKMFSATRRQASIVETHISLAQLDYKKRMLHIAFFLYKVTSQLERLEAEYFLCVPPDESSGTFRNQAQVQGRYLLKSGAYILVPATFHPYHCAKFTIQVHASRTVSLALL
ncbi:calpain-2 catalytic subunit-like [Nilaparvata lugens]|uniref:calpain-2 catalytic subunit-like n=1 Tax=Nilaparvata lugens TaxID=108931 RepID=UPI00193E2FCA|nr:calpain-2 catalytic subunit-like [Nilaparvata lugens]